MDKVMNTALFSKRKATGLKDEQGNEHFLIFSLHPHILLFVDVPFLWNVFFLKQFS